MLSAVVVLTCAVVVQAQNTLTGRWEGKTPNGFSVVLDVVATDSSLTGTLTRNGEPAAIGDGKVTKNTFSFTVTLNGQTDGMTGEITGDEVKIWMDRQGRERAMTLMRSK
jgi:hypothetical protein